jgi:hypothetical protein
MGKHFVAQRHLKRFQCPERPGWIWMFDKDKGESKLLPIEKVAQARGFYPEEIESVLTHGVEVPGLDAIDKLLASGELHEEERARLAYYTATQIRRVPNARRIGHDLLPAVLADVVQDIKIRITDAAAKGFITETRRDALLEEAAVYHLKAQNQTPEEVLAQINLPWPFESWLASVHNMQWRLLKRTGASAFLISDNPAYFFEGYGLGDVRGEVIMPLSSDFLLHCSWQQLKVKLPLITASERLVKTLNRRIASGATRCIFYHRDENWIFSAAKNTVEQLDRINWE